MPWLDLLDPDARSTPPRKRHHESVLLGDFLRRFEPALRIESPGIGEEAFVVVDVVDGHANAGTFWDEASVGKFDAAGWDETRGAGGGGRCVA